MIKYNFSINEGGYPSMGIDLEYEMLWEIGGCSYDYVRDIVKQLEAIKNGKIEKYDFANGNGTTIIECYSGKEDAVIWYKGSNWENLELWVSFEEIYNLMKDWLRYIEDWEEETSLIKK